MKKFALIVAAAVLLAGCSPKTPNTTVTPATDTTQMEELPEVTLDPAVAPQPMTVTLMEQNKSGESGTATLEEINGQVVVTISLVDSKSTVPQPGHIHVGACPEPGAVKFPLTDVVSGRSVTTINTTLAALQASKPLAVNLHKSATDMKSYTSCGDL